jgi:pimeloyl-ACP methyl ester carboxylesterase
LERAGHRVLAFDLPSLGRDKTPISEVSPTTWSDSVCQLLDAEKEPVVLVGHSRGGMIISQVAEARPSKVKTLVYLSAFLLRDGQFTAFLLKDGQSVLEAAQSESNADSKLLPNLIVNDDQGYATVREEAIQEAFYGRCSYEDVVLARLLLQPEAMAPLGTPIHTTPENFGRIPRVYIECLRDNAVTPAFQKEMYSVVPCQRVISMETDHSPFFSEPEELVSHLISIAV